MSPWTVCCHTSECELSGCECRCGHPDPSEVDPLRDDIPKVDFYK